MFDFTTENVLNDLSRVSVLTDTQDPSLPVGGKALYVKRLNKFKAGEVAKVWKAAATDPVLEISEVSVPASVTGLAGKVFRVAIDVTLSGSEAGAYSRWAVYKGQPFYAEYLVPATDPASVDAFGAALAASVNKALKKNGLSDIVITYNSGTDKLVATATNEYQRIQKFDLEVEDTTSAEGEFLISAEGAVTTPGKEGFGTSWFITKNLRLPTIEATRFMGEFLDERPIANSKYDQYTLELVVDRNITGQSAVGQKITSKTTHVFYVLTSLSATFEGYITSAFGPGTLVNALTGASANGTAIADISLSAITISAATAAAGTPAGSLTAPGALAPVSYALVAGSGDTNNALFTISGSVIKSAGAQTAGSKAIRVKATDANGNVLEKALTITVAS